MNKPIAARWVIFLHMIPTGQIVFLNKSENHFSNTIPLSLFQAANLDNFVCGQCGYVESYIAKEKDLATIKKK